MKEVHKKILPEYFEAVMLHEKNFEVRKDEDGIEVGDHLILEEYDPAVEHPGKRYTGRSCRRIVRYILRNAEKYGIKKDFIVIGF